jgi:hypothetical protein
VASDVLADLIEDVIFCNHQRPSIPSVILDVITDVIGNNEELKLQAISYSSVLESEIDSVCAAITDELVVEVTSSNNRNPSIPGVVLQLIMEMLMSGGDDKNNNENKNDKTKTENDSNVTNVSTASNTRIVTPAHANKADDKINQTAVTAPVKKEQHETRKVRCA